MESETFQGKSPAVGENEMNTRSATPSRSGVMVTAACPETAVPVSTDSVPGRKPIAVPVT